MENKKSHAVYNYMGCITHGSTQIVFRTEDLSTDDNAVGGTSYSLRLDHERFPSATRGWYALESYLKKTSS